MEHKGRVFTREQLLEQVWNHDYIGDDKIINSYCLLYGIVMAVMPPSYKSLLPSKYNERISQLVAGLEGSPLETANERLYDFCFAYGASAKLQGNGDSISFGGELEKPEDNVAQTATEIGGITRRKFSRSWQAKNVACIRIKVRPVREYK